MMRTMMQNVRFRGRYGRKSHASFVTVSVVTRILSLIVPETKVRAIEIHRISAVLPYGSPHLYTTKGPSAFPLFLPAGSTVRVDIRRRDRRFRRPIPITLQVEATS